MIILGKGKDVLISNLSKKIGDLRSKIYDPVANKRMCYGFRDWEIIKDERRLDYSQIVRSLFGIRSRYLASVDVSGCISRCFFCWVDWENEDSFENRFYSHEEIYGKLLSLNGNIWRFTGG